MEKSLLQRQAELSKFNDGAVRDSRVEDEIVPVIPHASNEVYDPSHPDADWTGRVARSFKKRTFNTHTAAKQVRIAQSVVHQEDLIRYLAFRTQQFGACACS